MNKCRKLLNGFFETKRAFYALALLVFASCAFLPAEFILGWAQALGDLSITFCASALIATSSVIVFFILFSEDQKNELISILTQAIEANLNAKNDAVRQGIASVADHLESSEIAKLISNALENNSLQHIVILKNWICSSDRKLNNDYENSFVNALKRNVKVTIVIMHPYSPLASRRSMDINGKVEAVESYILDTARNFIALRKKLGTDGGNLQLFCADLYSPMQVILLSGEDLSHRGRIESWVSNNSPETVSGTAALGFYTAYGNSNDAPQLYIKLSDAHGQTTLGNMLLRHISTVLKNCYTNPDAVLPLDLDCDVENVENDDALRSKASDSALRQTRPLLKNQALDLLHISERMDSTECEFMQAAVDTIGGALRDVSPSGQAKLAHLFSRLPASGGRSAVVSGQLDWEQDVFPRLRQIISVRKKKLSGSMADIDNSEVVLLDSWICGSRSEQGGIGSNLRNMFSEVLTAGIPMKVILLHPNSPNVRRREYDLEQEHVVVRKAIIDCLRDFVLVAWECSTPQNRRLPRTIPPLEIYCHDSIPSGQVILLPDVAFLGFYFKGKSSTENVHLQIPLSKDHDRDGTLMEKAITDHIDLLKAAIKSALETLSKDPMNSGENAGKTDFAFETPTLMPIKLDDLLGWEPYSAANPIKNREKAEHFVRGMFDGLHTAFQLADVAEVLGTIGDTSEESLDGTLVRNSAAVTINALRDRWLNTRGKADRSLHMKEIVNRLFDLFS